MVLAFLPRSYTVALKLDSLLIDMVHLINDHGRTVVNTKLQDTHFIVHVVTVTLLFDYSTPELSNFKSMTVRLQFVAK